LTRKRVHSSRGTRGITFDTGMLIAAERRKTSALVLLRACRLARVPITIPAAVVAEWWRGEHPGPRRVASAHRRVECGRCLGGGFGCTAWRHHSDRETRGTYSSSLSLWTA